MENKSFLEVLEYCKKKGFYLGEGNPDARTLFIGKEIGFGLEDSNTPSMDEILELSKQENSKNIEFWQKRINSNNLFNDLKDQETCFRKCPNSTWKNYQKTSNIIEGRNLDNIKFDFLNFSFITELNQIHLPNSKYADNNDTLKKEIRKSIENRKKLFEQSFFHNFPIVIMACGHYPREINFDIEKIFEVKWVGKTEVTSKKNWYNLHYGKDKILIHTRQFSNGISNDLTEKIGKEITKFLEK